MITSAFEAVLIINFASKLQPALIKESFFHCDGARMENSCEVACDVASR